MCWPLWRIGGLASALSSLHSLVLSLSRAYVREHISSTYTLCVIQTRQPLAATRRHTSDRPSPTATPPFRSPSVCAITPSTADENGSPMACVWRAIWNVRKRRLREKKGSCRRQPVCALRCRRAFVTSRKNVRLALFARVHVMFGAQMPHQSEATSGIEKAFVRQQHTPPAGTPRRQSDTSCRPSLPRRRRSGALPRIHPPFGDARATPDARAPPEKSNIACNTDGRKNTAGRSF